MLRQKVAQTESVRTVQRVIAQSETTKVVEENLTTYSVAELTAGYDKTAKELRLAQQALERVNHTTVVDFNPQY